MEKFDTRISITKALCIILMVIGHSGCPHAINDYFGLIRMPCFFFVSGFLLKEKYLSSMTTFFMRRIKGLWWPFVKWSVIFMLLHNIFTSLHIYNNSYTLTDMAYKFFHIITMTGSEQLLGGYWFLKELLYASAISIIALKLLHIIPNRKAGKDIHNGIILTLISLIFAYILSIIPFKIPTIGSRTLLSAACYFAGYTFHRLPNSNKSNLWEGILYLLIVFIISFYYTNSMSATDYDIFIYFSIAMIGTVGVIKIAGLIKGSTLKVLNYVGSKTLYILTIHFIALKLVSLFIILTNNLPITKLSDFPTISDFSTNYWVIYSITGVTIPLLIWEFSNYIQTKIMIIKKEQPKNNERTLY